MYKAVASNKRKTVFIMVGFAALIGVIGWLFAYYFDDMSILIYTSVIAVIYVVVQYFAAGELAVLSTGAKRIEQKDNPRLWNTVENLTITTGLPMPKVYVIDDPAPNAFATGRNPKHAIVAATTGLIDIMDDSELAAVMAHELSHVQNYDIRVSMITFGLVFVVGLISDIFARMIFFGGRRGSDRDSGGGAIGLVIGLVVAVLAPICAALAQMAVSRQREYLADSSAILITRYPESMIGALQKLEKYQKPMRQQNAATEALFINSPLRRGFWNNLFSTHPPLEKRIERLQNAKNQF